MAGKRGMPSGRRGKTYVKHGRLKVEISLSGEDQAYWRGQAVAVLGREPADKEVLDLARDGIYDWLATLRLYQ